MLRWTGKKKLGALGSWGANVVAEKEEGERCRWGLDEKKKVAKVARD